LTREEQEVVVLLADEDQATRDVFGNLTGRGTGITGVATSSGPAALLAAGQLRPRIVIFDLFIGEVDGFAAVRALASHEATGATTVIATSRALTPDVVRAAKGSGADEVLQRPLRARALGRLLRNLRRGR
jgi:CheY-like chemotaxis protein